MWRSTIQKRQYSTVKSSLTKNNNSFLFLIDYILFSIVVFTIMCNLLNFVFNIAALRSCAAAPTYVTALLFAIDQNSLVLCVKDSTSHTENVNIVNTDGTWSSTIKRLFIYGTGALRVAYSKTPTGRLVNTVGTLAIAKGSEIIDKAVNDPNYIKDHVQNWRMIWDNKRVAQWRTSAQRCFISNEYTWYRSYSSCW